MEITAAVEQALGLHNVQRPVEADTLDESQTDAILARGMASHVLQRHDDRPTHVARAGQGLAIVGQQKVVLVENNGRVRVADLPQEYIDECACGCGACGGSPGEPSGGVVNGQEATVADIALWMNEFVLPRLSEDDEAYDAEFDDGDLQAALELARQKTEEVGIDRDTAEELLERFRRQAPRGTSILGKLGMAARNSHAHPKVSQHMQSVNSLRKAVRSIFRSSKKPRTYREDQELQTDLTTEELRDFVREAAGPKITEQHRDLIIAFDAADSADDLDAMLAAASPLLKALGIEPEQAEVIAEAVLTASPKHKARKGVLGPAVSNALRNASRRSEAVLDRDEFDRLLPTLQEWLLGVAGKLDDDGRTKLVDAFDQAVQAGRYEQAVEAANNAARQAEAEVPDELRPVLEYQKQNSNTYRKFVRSLRNQTSFEKAKNKLRRVAYRQHRSSILRSKRVYRKRFGRKMGMVARSRGMESVEEAQLTVPPDFAPMVSEMLDEAGIVGTEERTADSYVFTMPDDELDVLLSYLDEQIDEQQAADMLEASRKKRGMVGKQAKRFGQRNGRVVQGTERIPERPTPPSRQPRPTGMNGAVGGGALSGEPKGQPTPTGESTDLEYRTQVIAELVKKYSDASDPLVKNIILKAIVALKNGIKSAKRESRSAGGSEEGDDDDDSDGAFDIEEAEVHLSVPEYYPKPPTHDEVMAVAKRHNVSLEHKQSEGAAHDKVTRYKFSGFKNKAHVKAFHHDLHASFEKRGARASYNDEGLGEDLLDEQYSMEHQGGTLWHVKHNGQHVGSVQNVKGKWQSTIGHHTKLGTHATPHAALKRVKRAHQRLVAAVVATHHESEDLDELADLLGEDDEGDTVSLPPEMEAELDDLMDQADQQAEDDGGVYYVVYDLENDEAKIVDEDEYGQYMDGDLYVTVYATEEEEAPDLASVYEELAEWTASNDAYQRPNTGNRSASVKKGKFVGDSAQFAKGETVYVHTDNRSGRGMVWVSTDRAGNEGAYCYDQDVKIKEDVDEAASVKATKTSGGWNVPYRGKTLFLTDREFSDAQDDGEGSFIGDKSDGCIVKGGCYDIYFADDNSGWYVSRLGRKNPVKVDGLPQDESVDEWNASGRPYQRPNTGDSSRRMAGRRRMQHGRLSRGVSSPVNPGIPRGRVGEGTTPKPFDFNNDWGVVYKGVEYTYTGKSGTVLRGPNKGKQSREYESDDSDILWVDVDGVPYPGNTDPKLSDKGKVKGIKLTNARSEGEEDEDDLDEAAFRPMPTNNEGYGFWGTAYNASGANPDTTAEKVGKVWDAASRFLKKMMPDATPKQVRDMLDSTIGRHFADTLYGTAALSANKGDADAPDYPPAPVIAKLGAAWKSQKWWEDSFRKAAKNTAESLDTGAANDQLAEGEVEESVPGIAKWSMSAGGTGAAAGKHGYTHHTEHGEYHISPHTHSNGRHAGYLLKFAHTKGTGKLPHGGLWHDLGNHRSPQAAAKAAKEHHKKISEGLDEAKAKCPKCGKKMELKGDSRKCPECGAEVTQDNVTESEGVVTVTVPAGRMHDFTALEPIKNLPGDQAGVGDADDGFTIDLPKAVADGIRQVFTGEGVTYTP